LESFSEIGQPMGEKPKHMTAAEEEEEEDDISRFGIEP